MSFRDKSIKIVCWTGKDLFIGPYDDPQVDTILEANRCPHCIEDRESCDSCDSCDSTGYIGDFEIYWIDESDKENCNIYEYINY